MQVYLALDIGKVRTGIAKSDAMGLIIKPLKTVKSDELIKELQELEKEYSFEKFIIGKPINISEGSNETLKMVESKAKEITGVYPKIEQVFVNEAFTSKEAEAAIKSQGIKLGKDNKELVDAYAAAIILEEYWDN